MSQSKRSSLPVAASVLLGGLFLFVAVTKILHIYAFEGAVDLILARVFPTQDLPFALIRVAITIGVVAVEAMLGTSLIVFARSAQIPSGIAMIVLLVFSAVLVRLAFMKDPPPCGCLGGIELAVRNSRDATLAGLVRNVGLLILAGWIVTASRVNNNPKHPRADRSSAQSRAHGFTIIEILVSIVVIGVLIAILLPALAGARKQAKDTTILSSIRQAGVAVTDYTNEENGYLPFRGKVHAPRALYFRGQAMFWPTTLLDHGIDLDGKLPRTRLTESKVIETFFWLTHAAHARPEYWGDDDSVIENDLLYEGARIDEALFPSRKGMLIDVAFNEQSTGASVAFLDGSATYIPFSETPLQIESDLRRPFSATPWHVLTTPDGIRGIDY